jgi:hypothetical protein
MEDYEDLLREQLQAEFGSVESSDEPPRINRKKKRVNPMYDSTWKAGHST